LQKKQVVVVLQTNGSGVLSFASGGGKVLQVVSAIKTDTSSTTSSSYGDVSGLSVSITPSSASNKILIISALNIGHSNAVHRTHVRLTGGNSTTYVGASAGGAYQTAGSFTTRASTDSYTQQMGTLVFLDSPATTSAITYKVQFLSSSDTAYINRTGTLDGNTGNGASTITVMEIAG
jgi:hypothetical protein